VQVRRDSVCGHDVILSLVWVAATGAVQWGAAQDGVGAVQVRWCWLCGHDAMVDLGLGCVFGVARCMWWVGRDKG
jgi:hypothetical protein